jgi:hypothetical protein
MAIQGLGQGANRLAQYSLMDTIAQLNTRMAEKARAMGGAPAEQVGSLRAELEQMSFILEQTLKALELLFKADKESKGPQ